MADKLTRQIALMLQSNERLQQLADEEAWECFTEEVAAYARGMQALCEFDLSQLLAQDERLRQRMSVRLGHLSNNISALLKSNASAQAYHTV